MFMNETCLEVLDIGNSFSQDATTYIERIAESTNIAVAVRNAFYPGCSLREHVDFF